MHNAVAVLHNEVRRMVSSSGCGAIVTRRTMISVFAASATAAAHAVADVGAAGAAAVADAAVARLRVAGGAARQRLGDRCAHAEDDDQDGQPASHALVLPAAAPLPPARGITATT